MKSRLLYLVILPMLYVVSGCKKETRYTSNGPATLTIVNGILSKTILLKMNGTINSSGVNASGTNQARVNYGAGMFFYANAKTEAVAFLNAADSSTLVSKNLDLQKGGVYTLLLAGAAPNADAILVDDSQLPFVNQSKAPADADSIVYVRFINLSPDTQPIDIKIQGAANNEVTGLAFKQASYFKAYPGKITNYSGTIGYSTIAFEFKENGTVLRSFTLFIYTPLNRFKNIALVLTGKKTPTPGEPGLAVSTVNYFQ